MKSLFRKTYFTLYRSVNPNPNPSLLLISRSLPPRKASSPLPLLVSHSQNEPFCSFCSSICFSSSMAGADSHALSSAHSLEDQFKDLRELLEVSGSLRDRIRAVAAEIESTGRLMQASLLLVHQSRPVAEVLEGSKSQIKVLKELYSQLVDIVRECPGQYYRYHGDWRSETQNVVSLLVFMHWLETGNLLLHSGAEEKLGLNNSEFGLDIEDYLIGVCFMSNEMPRYVVNRVTVGDYDCPRKVLKFMTALHTAFRILNLRNDFLRKKFDGLKYDLRRVEEVYYDVKIRGLVSTGDTTEEENVVGQS